MFDLWLAKGISTNEMLEQLDHLVSANQTRCTYPWASPSACGTRSRVVVSVARGLDAGPSLAHMQGEAVWLLEARARRIRPRARSRDETHESSSSVSNGRHA